MNSLIPISNLQHQQTLRPHIEQQIYNAQVRQKAVLLLKDLVIGFGRELRVFQSEVFLRMDAFAEIRFIRVNSVRYSVVRAISGCMSIREQIRWQSSSLKSTKTHTSFHRKGGSRLYNIQRKECGCRQIQAHSSADAASYRGRRYGYRASGILGYPAFTVGMESANSPSGAAMVQRLR